MAPHGLLGCGKSERFTMLRAGVESSVRETWLLLSNGPLSWSALPDALHDGDNDALKSPFVMASVGMWAKVAEETERRMVVCWPMKKNSLSFTIRPPRVPPNWLRLSESRVFAKAFLAFKSPLRKNSNRSP